MRFTMNKSRLIGTACATVFSFIAVPMDANAVIIDFEDISIPASSISGSSQTSGGYSFVNTTTTNDDILAMRLSSWCAGGCVDNGTQYLAVYNSDQTGPFEVEMTRNGGGLFDLLSFDFASLFKFVPAPGTEVLDVIATAPGGVTISQSFNYDNIGDEFQIAMLGSQFSGLQSVLFSSQFIFPAYDNIEVSAVPIPAAVWLFGSGLLGLVGIARRKKIA